MEERKNKVNKKFTVNLELITTKKLFTRRIFSSDEILIFQPANWMRNLMGGLKQLG